MSAIWKLPLQLTQAVGSCQAGNQVGCRLPTTTAASLGKILAHACPLF